MYLVLQRTPFSGQLLNLSEPFLKIANPRVPVGMLLLYWYQLLQVFGGVGLEAKSNFTSRLQTHQLKLHLEIFLRVKG